MSATLAAHAGAVETSCEHCGLPTPPGCRFCCPGCEAAFGIVQGLGLGRYYRDRSLDPATRAPRPDGESGPDLIRAVTSRPDGSFELIAFVDGLQCGACVWLIESLLTREPGVTQARINLTTRRLRLAWTGAAADVAGMAARVTALGYRLVPYTASSVQAANDAAGRRLLRALAVAGFAAGNVMLIAIGIWAGERQGMGPGTRDLLHLVSAVIALPCIAIAGQPFFSSAWSVIVRGRTNMDVPISLGLLLVTGLSIWQTFVGGSQTYFESAVMLLLVLLVGRVMDHCARGKARTAVEELLLLRSVEVTVIGPDGVTARRRQDELTPGDCIFVGMGERIGADGVIESGLSAIDASLVTGESLPTPARPGSQVYAGTLNVGAPLTVRITAVGSGTILAECVRMIEAAEAQRSRYVVLADRVARAYAPAVHLTALLTFLFWISLGGASFSDALIAAIAVLIVTCPCALALAIPLVQVIATGRLFARGILLKSPTALERLAAVDTVCFDKTGTLTEPELRLAESPGGQVLQLAATLAAGSRHPLARALCAAASPVSAAPGLTEIVGVGMECPGEGDGKFRLGRASFCDAQSQGGAELFLAQPGAEPIRFGFIDHLRDDAGETILALKEMGLGCRILSGDHADRVAAIASNLGIETWRSDCRPAQKVDWLQRWGCSGDTVLMVGDGLNDSPALAAASVSASPASASDMSQAVADVIYQGRSLAPVAELIRTGRRARRIMRQNIALSLAYNAVAVPIAMAGLVEPWMAAVLMSTSSLLVIANSIRVRQ